MSQEYEKTKGMRINCGQMGSGICDRNIIWKDPESTSLQTKNYPKKIPKKEENT